MHINELPGKACYVAAWKKCKKVLEENGPKFNIKAVNWYSEPVEKVKRDFDLALQLRINERGNLKTDSRYNAHEMQRAARAINDPRLVIDWLDRKVEMYLMKKIPEVLHSRMRKYQF